MRLQSTTEQSSLSVQQHAALQLLSAGLTVNYTALVLKVSSSAIHHWLTHDVAFKVELARRQHNAKSE